MSSQTPHNDVQQELEGLSPELARLREKETPSVNMEMLHRLGSAALEAVPIEVPQRTIPPTMNVVHRKRSWKGLVAAAVAVMIGALLTYSVLNTTENTGTDYVLSNEAISAELIASFEEQTADPIAFLLDEDVFYADEESLFSPAEDILLDWADDGNVDEALSEEVILDVLR